jgi:hypothetical protein
MQDVVIIFTYLHIVNFTLRYKVVTCGATESVSSFHCED